jgi:hypothetical protein
MLVRFRLLSRKGARHAGAASFQADYIASGPPLGVRRGRARQGGKLPDSAERYEHLKKIRQAEAAANIEAWANSPKLQPPK